MANNDPSVPNVVQTRKEWLLIVVGSLLFTLGFYFSTPSLWDSMDFVFFYRPNFQFLHDAIWSGTIPLWNPHIGLGRPFLADSQNAVFYPLIWLVVLGPHIALVLLTWIHHVIAFAGMRKLTESSGAQKIPALIAAVAFVLSGPLVSRWSSGQIMYCCAIAYMPWLFILARQCFERFAWKRIAATALVLALQFLCGHPQIFWVTGIGMGLYILGLGLFPISTQKVTTTFKALGQLALASAWSLAITACVLLPFLTLIEEGNRSESVTFAAFGKMPHAAFLSLFGTLKPLWEYNIFTGWWLTLPGLAGLTLIRHRECRAWLFIVVISVLMALGDDTPMFTLNYHLLPGFAKMRFVARIAILIPMGLLICGAIWLSRKDFEKSDLLRVLLVANAAIWLVWYLYETPVNPWQLPLAINLYAFGLPAILVLIATVLRPQQRAQTVLAIIAIGCLIEIGSEAWSTKSIYRMENVSGIDPSHPGQLILAKHLSQHFPYEEGTPPPRVLINSHAVPESYGMIYGYSSPDAYTSLFLKRPWDYLHGMLGITSPSLANTYLSYNVYRTTPFPWPAIAQDVGFHPEQGLINNPEPKPRAYLSFSAEPPRSSVEVLNLLTNEHDIYRSTLIESSLSNPLPTNDLPAQIIPIKTFRKNEIALEFEAPRDGLLVLAEAWYPGWQAGVNETVSPIIPVNYWMRAVPISAGKQTVRIFYREKRLPIGITISAISLILAISIILRPRKVKTAT